MRAGVLRRARGALTALMLLGAASGCAVLPAPGAAPTASEAMVAELDSLFADPQLEHAHWGILVRSLRTGETLYQRQPERLFVPASNQKLITGAVALEALGPDYRYRTEVAAGGAIRDGVVQGPLVVRGSGDPTLSDRFFDDPRASLRAWADSLRARGVTRVAGGIVAIDSAFVGPPLGAGWSWDDLASGYAAEFTGLQYNEGVVEVQVLPSRSVGEPPVVILSPPTQYVPVINRAITTAPGTETRIALMREPTGPGIEVHGQIPADSGYFEETVAVRNPTLYFATALRQTLREAGIAVEGRAVDADDFLPGELPVGGAQPLFVHHSAPLREILPAMLQPSQNWIAETLLRTVGREVRGEGSGEAGAAVADSLLGSWGLDTLALRIADGSGLSRYNLLSPELLAGLLSRMAQSPYAEVWYASLPVGGVSGTLERRQTAPPLRGNVRAKTGTLSGVRSLSGYLTPPDGEPLVFSILVNNHMRRASDVDRVVDAALARLATLP